MTDQFSQFYGGTTKTRSNLLEGGAIPGVPKYKAPAVAGVPSDIGNISVNPTDPIGSIDQAGAQGANILDGLKNFLFGTSAPDKRTGSHGGLLGDMPLVGDLARAGSETVANALGAVASVPGHAADFIGGALEHVPLPSGEDVRAKFDALDDDDPIKQQAVLAMDDTSGPVPPAAEHIMAMALQQKNEALNSEDPQLFDNLFVPTVSLADAVTNLFGILGAGERIVERGYAGFDSLQEGMDQLDMIVAVGDGTAGFKPSWSFGGDNGGFDTKLTPVEQHAYEMIKANAWSHEQGLDYLASHGRGISHDQLSQIAGSVAFDPIGDAAIVASAGAAIGLKGVEISQGVRAAEAAVTSARELKTMTGAARLARAGELAAQGFEDISKFRGKVFTNKVDTLIKTAEERFVAAQKSFAGDIIKNPGTSARLNLMGRMMETPQGSQMVRILSRPYLAAQETNVGRSFKIARTIVDPLHAFSIPGLGPQLGNEGIDLTTELVTRTAIDGAFGRPAHIRLMDFLSTIDGTGDLQAAVSDHLGTHFGNITREVIATAHRDNNLRTMGAALAKENPNTIVDELMKHAKKPLLQTIKETANRFIERTWLEDDIQNLGTRMERMYGHLTKDEWVGHIRGMSPEQRSLLHVATYGNANERLFEVIAAVERGIVDGTIKEEGLTRRDLLQRVILLNKTTLTNVGADGILERLTAAEGEIGKQISEMRLAQSMYPQLNYISIDPTDLQGTIRQFQNFVEKTKKFLPAQAMDDELAKAPLLQALQDEMYGAFTLGFRPEQEFIWGMVATGDGVVPFGSVFVDHVARSGAGYRVAQGVGRGPHGLPIMLRRPVDWVQANASLMMNAVSGSMISEAAKQKFVGRLSEKWFSSSVDKRVANEIWNGIHDMMEAQAVVVNPRGFDPRTLFKAVEGIIPPEARHAGLDENVIMGAVLDAYQGDLRFVGATQWLSGRAKAAAFQMTGSNMLGQIAEMAWPLLKFRVNLVFQGQERIEGWVLNAQRGVNAAIGVKMTPMDELTDRVLQNTVERSLTRMGDIDLSEQSNLVMYGGKAAKVAATPGAKLNKMREMGAALTDVQGNKRLNLLRTFRKDIGREIRGVWDEVYPGEFDRMKLAEQARAGHMITDDDYAIQLLAEHQLGNDVAVRRMIDAGGKFTGIKADFRAAISTGEWMKPSHFGQLRALELDDVASLTGAGGAKDLKGLRAALASGKTTVDDVKRVLRMYGADPDYVRRVENALTFNWDDFWVRLSDSFSLTPEQAKSMQELIGGIAETRQMTPVEYLSQVFAPNIIGGREAAIGSLGDAVDVVLNGRTETISNLAKFAAGDQSGFDDLVRQFTHVFAQHLDPSLKKALLMEFQPEIAKAVRAGTLKLDLTQIENMFNATARDSLADRILGYMNGAPGSGKFQPVTDEAIGARGWRNARAQYMLNSGRTELPTGRRMYEVNDKNLKAIANDHHRAQALPLPEATEVSPKSLRESLTSKPTVRTSAAPPRVSEAYQEWVNETRQQYLHMTMGKQKVRVKLVKSEPYIRRDKRVNGLSKKQFLDEFNDLIENVQDGRATLAEQARYDKLLSALTPEEIDHLVDPAIGFPVPDELWKASLAKNEKIYRDADLQADLKNGIVRVWTGDTAHPIMTPEQVVEYRAVHTVFGHGAEGFDRTTTGRLNAISAHAQMYDAEARSAMLSDQLGRVAYDAAPPPGPKPFSYTDIDDAERKLFGSSVKTDIKYAVEDENGKKVVVHRQERRIGENLRNADPALQKEVITLMASLHERFPHVKLDGFDVANMNAIGEHDALAVTIMTTNTTTGSTRNFILVGDHVATPEGRQAIDEAVLKNQGAYTEIPSFRVQQGWDRDTNAINYKFFGVKKNARNPYLSVFDKEQAKLNAWMDVNRPKTRTQLDAIVEGMMNKFGMTDVEAERDLIRIAEGNNLPDWYAQMVDDVNHVPTLDQIMQDPDFPTHWEALTEYQRLTKEAEWARNDIKVYDSVSTGYQKVFESYIKKQTGPPIPRKSPAGQGIGWITGATVESTLTHEFGHAMMNSLVIREDYGHDVANQLRLIEEDFLASGQAKYVSEYGSGSKLFGPSEPFAELIAGMFSKDATAFRARVAANRPSLAKMMKEIEDTLAKEGIYVPPPEIPRYAPKGNLLDSKSLRQFSDEMIGVGRYSEANPDVGRTARYFGQFMEKAVGGILSGDPAVPGDHLGEIFKRFGMMPKGPATPYNFSEGLLNDLAVNGMKAKWKDAYRLQYFQQDRSMLQRSINHPMFGIYPASYMWGKILPEMATMILQKPFGTRTGAMMDNLLTAQRAVALRREFDPAFDKHIEDVGHNAALSFLGYMLPAVPWDVNAGVPVWMRDIAKQGLANEKAVSEGKAAKNADLAVPAADTVKKLVPYTTTIPWAARAGNELPWSETPAEKAKRQGSGPVTGAQIGDTLSTALEELRDALR